MLGVPGRLRAIQGGYGKKADFLRALKMKAPQWNRYQSGERLPEGDVLDRISKLSRLSPTWILTGAEADETESPYMVRESLVRESTLRESPPSSPKPLHLRDEWQETHAFTAMVDALARLEETHDAHAVAAWEAIVGLSAAIRDLADWTDEDWKAILDNKRDHWRRLTRHRENDTIHTTLRGPVPMEFDW